MCATTKEHLVDNAGSSMDQEDQRISKSLIVVLDTLDIQVAWVRAIQCVIGVPQTTINTLIWIGIHFSQFVDPKLTKEIVTLPVHQFLALLMQLPTQRTLLFYPLILPPLVFQLGVLHYLFCPPL